MIKANREKYALNYCICYSRRNIFDKITSWPQLISKHLVALACLDAASD